MSFIPGMSLYDVWFRHHLHGVNPDVVRERRIRALEGIASSVFQLRKFSSPLCGIPLFEGGTDISSVRPIRQIDSRVMLDRWCAGKDPSDMPIYAILPVSSDPQVYYSYILDLYPKEDIIFRVISALLRQFIRWIPEPSDTTDLFVLAHPDFDIRNFGVSEDGELQGIIDWDGVAVIPRSLGNEKYPGWLTRDWDLAM